MTSTRRRTATPHNSKKSEQVILHHSQNSQTQTTSFAQEFNQPITQATNISYLNTSLQILSFFVLTIYARTYIAMLTRELYPIVYNIAVGEVPSFYSLRYHLTYRPGLEYTVNTAYNYGPVAITTGLFLVAKFMPALASGVKKTYSFLRSALLSNKSDDIEINVQTSKPAYS